MIGEAREYFEGASSAWRSFRGVWREAATRQRVGFCIEADTASQVPSVEEACANIGRRVWVGTRDRCGIRLGNDHHSGGHKREPGERA